MDKHLECVPFQSAMGRRADSSQSLEDAYLDPASLAGMLEASTFIRNRLRFNDEGKLLRWPKDEKTGREAIGRMSMLSIGLNVKALTILARYWCPKSKKLIQSPGIDLVRDEVWATNQKKQFTPDSF